MAISRGPKLTTNGLVLALDAGDNNSFSAVDLPVKNGLLLWLDAADDATFVFSSGTEVSQWRDKSGNNFHANQATTANQPSRNTVVNSRKSVNFTSANGDRLRVNSGMVFTNSVTAIVFIKPGTQNFPYADILDQDHAMDGYNGWVIQRNNAASQWLVWLGNEANTTWLNTNAVSYADNTPQIVTLRKGSSTLTLSSNGTSSGDVAIADQQIRQVGYLGLNIGSWRAGNELFSSSRHYNGEICEIVVYNRALSLTELKQVHTYLGQKWGVVNADRSIVDASGSAYVGLLGNGTTSAMPVYDFYNKGALKFDGTDDYVVGTVPSIAASSTVAMWIKCSNYENKIPISIAGAIYGSGPNIFFYSGLINWNTGDGAGNPFSGSSYPNSNWHYIVITNDAATNAKLYIDGSLIGTAAYRNTLSTNSNNFWLGRFSGNNDYTINANIAAAQLYNRVLSANEVLQNYNVQKTRFENTIIQQGLILNLDAGNPYSYAGSGATWYDASGNSNNATLINSPTYSVDNGGLLNWASASSQYATVAMNSGLRVANITQEVWVFLNSTADQVFIGSQYGTSSNNSFALWLQSGTFYFGVNTGGTFYYTSSSSASAGTWYHLIHTYNATTQYLYINGVLVATYNSAASGNISYDTSNTLLAIGADFNGSGYNVGPSAYTNGKMPVVRIYNIALSAAQVLQNYNATKGRFGL
jgi:hypothetical protein